MNNAVYEELDMAKAELEKLRDQYSVKLEFSERLKRSHEDQLSKNKEANSKLEKLARDLNEKNDEIYATKKMYDDVKSKLTEKESIIKHLTSARDKVCLDFSEKLHKCEEENKALASSLDDANAKNVDQEKEIHAFKQEIEGVKRALAISVEKRKETENSVLKNSKEDVCLRLEEENSKFEEQLKWKKEQFVHLEEAYKKLRNELKTKENEWEKEKNALLDDAYAKNVDHEKQIHAFKQEIEDVKRVLTISEKTRSKAENLMEHSKETREDVWLRLEEEKRKFEDQLKWKNEQFVHLEEAHKKLQDEFKTKENGWEKEKNALLDDFSSLQMNLESQVRLSQDLQWRIEMCNEALAHMESKKKLLELELLESRASFDNVCGEYEAAKLNFESLIVQRDREMATLRSSLGMKEILYKDIEYQFKKLELEKHDLLVSVKELQEEQIISSSSKLQNKLKSLENVHKGCSTNLKAREREWRLEMEKLTEEVNFCKEELKSKDLCLDELKMKMEIINQETSLMLLVLKSGFSEARLGISRTHACMEQQICGLMEELEKKNDDLKQFQNELDEEREKVVILAENKQILEEIPKKNDDLKRFQKELDEEREKVVILAKNKQILEEMLKESSTCQVDQSRSDLEKVNEALDRANEELYEKYCEASEIEFELQLWKSMAEKMEVNLEQSLRTRREVEASLIAQINIEMNLKREKEDLRHLLQGKEKRINELEQQLVEPSRREETSLQNILEEKDERIHDLQQLVTSLEREFESSTGSFSSKLSQMQKEMKLFQEKIKETEVLKEIEIQDKNLVIVELENNLCDLQNRVESREKGVVEMEKMVNERIERLSVEDMKLMRSLEKIVETIDVNEPREVEREDYLKENMDVLFCSSPSMKKVEAIHEERLPFRAIN